MNPFELAQAATESDRTLAEVSPVYGELAAIALHARATREQAEPVDMPGGLRRAEEEYKAREEIITGYRAKAEVHREAARVGVFAEKGQGNHRFYSKLIIDYARATNDPADMRQAFAEVVEGGIDWSNLLGEGFAELGDIDGVIEVSEAEPIIDFKINLLIGAGKIVPNERLIDATLMHLEEKRNSSYPYGDGNRMSRLMDLAQQAAVAYEGSERAVEIAQMIPESDSSRAVALKRIAEELKDMSIMQQAVEAVSHIESDDVRTNLLEMFTLSIAQVGGETALADFLQARPDFSPSTHTELGLYRLFGSQDRKARVQSLVATEDATSSAGTAFRERRWSEIALIAAQHNDPEAKQFLADVKNPSLAISGYVALARHDSDPEIIEVIFQQLNDLQTDIESRVKILEEVASLSLDEQRVTDLVGHVQAALAPDRCSIYHLGPILEALILAQHSEAAEELFQLLDAGSNQVQGHITMTRGYIELADQVSARTS